MRVPEHCLLCPPRTIHNLAPRRLLLAQCINHIFRNTIATSPALQERLFLQPMHKSLNVQLPNLDGPRKPLSPRGRVHNVFAAKASSQDTDRTARAQGLGDLRYYH